MSNSATDRPPLDGQHFNVVVVGGGINGIAIARQCAQSGKRTLLLEKNDFGSGTTSRSTRIIHGGLRYMEHGEIGLVRESLRERNRMLRQQPHLVRPMQFLLALQAGSRHSALAIRAGLWLYSALAGAPRNKNHNRAEIHALESLLDAGKSWSIFSYDDAQCEFPERLLAEWLCDGLQAGAVARNHSAVLDLHSQAGRARRVIFRDQFTRAEETVEADWIINATGPWADRLCDQFELHGRNRMVSGVRGSHIVLPTFPGAPHAAVYSEAPDGRPIYVIPWNGQLLAGTTEVADENDPEESQPSLAEINYLLSSVQRLFPLRQFSASDIHYAFAGVRPLPYSPGKSAAAITRRHFIHDHSEEGAAGMLSIIGGKLTTAASLARECARKIGIDAPEPQMPLALASHENIDSSLQHWAAEVAATAHISEASALMLVEWHGSRALTLARMAAQYELYRFPLCEHSTHLVVEAVAAVEQEYAFTLGDILLRRVPVALGACWNEDCSRLAAHRIGEALHWDRVHRERELENFRAERFAFLHPSPMPTLTAARSEGL